MCDCIYNLFCKGHIMFIDESTVRRLDKLLLPFDGLSGFIRVLDQAAQQDCSGLRDVLERTLYRWLYG